MKKFLLNISFTKILIYYIIRKFEYYLIIFLLYYKRVFIAREIYNSLFEEFYIYIKLLY